MNTPLSSFTALVKFKFDRAGLTTEIAAVRKQLQGLVGKTIGVKLQASSISLKGAKLTYIPKLKLQASTISLRDARYTYKGKLKSKDFPPIKQEVKLHYTGKLTTLPPITQVVNMVYRNRQGNTTTQHTQGGGNTRGGNTNPWRIGDVVSGLGGRITRGNLAAFGVGAGLQQMYTTANFTAAREPRYEFLTGSKEDGAKQIKYINDLVDELHLNLMDTDEAYTQFLGAVNSSIGAAGAQKTFKTIQSFGVMMGANPEQMKRGTKAIQQMLSKQKLSAEELTGTNVPDYPRNGVMRTYLMREALRA